MEKKAGTYSRGKTAGFYHKRDSPEKSPFSLEDFVPGYVHRVKRTNGAEIYVFVHPTRDGEYPLVERLKKKDDFTFFCAGGVYSPNEDIIAVSRVLNQVSIRKGRFVEVYQNGRLVQ